MLPYDSGAKYLHDLSGQCFGIAAVITGFRGRKSQVRARRAQYQSCGWKNLQVAKLIAQAEFMVSLEFVAVAGSADTLKVFATIGIAAFNRRMSLAGTMWSTWRLIPACLKSTPHDSTSHFPRSADVRCFSIPSEMGGAPAISAPRGSSVPAFLGYRSGTRNKHIAGGDTSCGRGKLS